MKIQFIPLFITLLISSLGHAEEKKDFTKENLARQVVIGSVVKVHGNATVLSYKLKLPKPVAPGQDILSDSSFYCPTNCLINIKLHNKLGFVTIGHNTSAFIFKHKKSFTIRLHSGFVKTLFKSDEVADEIKIMTHNSISKAQNSKTLFIYNSLFKKTSIVNYKGSVNFSSINDKSNSVSLDALEYSYIDKRMKAPEKAHKLTKKQLKQLLSASEIDEKKLD